MVNSQMPVYRASKAAVSKEVSTETITHRSRRIVTHYLAVVRKPLVRKPVRMVGAHSEVRTAKRDFLPPPVNGCTFCVTVALQLVLSSFTERVR